MTIARRLTLFVLLALSPLASSGDQPFDLVIVQGHIIDGTGSPWYSADIGIRAGRIAAIGNLSASPRKRTIDAQGKVVAPGFIDMLGQSESTILVENIPGNHHRSHGRGRIDRSLERRHHRSRSRRLRALQN
jgi:Urease alpha-subunit, N-terminal domain